MTNVDVVTGIVSRDCMVIYSGQRFAYRKSHVIEEWTIRGRMSNGYPLPGEFMRAWAWNAFLSCYDPIMDKERSTS